MLDNKMLKYYKKEEDYTAKKVPKGVLNFQQIWVEPIFKPAELKIDLAIVGTTRVFFLKLANLDDFKNWQACLKHSISTSIGTLKKRILDNSQQNYWRFLRISEEGVHSEAQIGDIIISKTKTGILAGSQPYVDRVALVLRLHNFS